MEAHPEAQLVLSWRARNATLKDTHASVSLGTDPGVDLSVEGRYASRRHARVERRKQDYVLIDHSTNGTFVQTEDERVSRVHRGEMRLWGAGWISLGEPLCEQTAIRFESI